MSKGLNAAADDTLVRSSEKPGALVFYSQFDEPEPWRVALKEMLPELDFRVHPDVGNPDEVRFALVWRPEPGFFAGFKNLQLVVNLGAGVDSLTNRDDLPDVPISRLSDKGMIALMRSYVLFAVIRYARDMPSFEQAKRRREWHYIHPRPLHQTRVGVVGLGVLGAAVATALAELGFDVRGLDKEEKQVPGVKCMRHAGGWDDFLGDLDILVNMMPLTGQTRKLIGADVFDGLPKGAKFINASRGQVVDEDALIAALRDGHLGGATLDVFENEPLSPDHPFWDMENVYITPHLASITVPEMAARDVAESIRLILSGQDPLHCIDPGKGY
ncbi:2-hydroxyacid dehydrogenase [Nitratireductor soli]|uniref:2-hydroxyacid dehydrogenase n=1 Tax=Nitratireductor soli TaxID=1670619 RepID=UPI0009E5F160|nr:glyoxylate/hydroxypyruvate reductase A [Nitratireductor soli]